MTTEHTSRNTSTKNSETGSHVHADKKLVVGVFDSQEKATRLVEKLIQEDFPADQLSLLHKSGGLGDDVLGLTYSDSKDRIKIWGEHGAFWGALWGLLAGTTGLFVLPGVGSLLAAGPIVEALGGAVAGATLAGGAMAGAAAVTELTTALHRLGIPEEKLKELHNFIEQGHYLIVLHCSTSQSDFCLVQLRWAGADPVLDLRAT